MALKLSKCHVVPQGVCPPQFQPPALVLCLLGCLSTECKVSGKEAQRNKPLPFTIGPTLSLLRKEKSSFGPKPESISHRTALLRERDHCHAWVPSPAEGGSQSLPDIGVIPQSSMPPSLALVLGLGTAYIWPLCLGLCIFYTGFLPTWPQKVKISPLLCFLLTLSCEPCTLPSCT